MSAVSLTKIPVAAANARNARIAIGGIPVLVRDVTPVRPGAVLLVGVTANGAEVSRVFPAGQTFAPVPTGH